MLLFEAGTPLKAVFQSVRLPSTPAFRIGVQGTTKVFRPSATPAARRLPSKVDMLMMTMLMGAADLAKDLTGVTAEIEFERSSTLGIVPRVMQGIVGNAAGLTRVSVEDKSPAVGQSISPFSCPSRRNQGAGKSRGSATVPGTTGRRVWQLSYYLTDDQNAHEYAILHDARCLHILVKRNAHNPSFFISPAIDLDDARLFHVLTHLFLWDPPSSLEDGYDPPDEQSLPNSAETPPHSAAF
ncbi:hypothetical protein DFH06DRAFT_1313625 [Mycena polygramma]|nr:hypothetical protein DFH06DRAFT_1313625 [Mycena polygramma]